MKCIICKQNKPSYEFTQDLGKGKYKYMQSCSSCCLRAKQAAISGRKLFRQHEGCSYKRRDFSLHELGFSSYSEYLSSDLWKIVQKRVYIKRPKLCMLCYDKSTCLHHNRYHGADLCGSSIKFIIPLCNSCHEYLEYDSNGLKRKLKDVKLLYERIRLGFVKSLPSEHWMFLKKSKEAYISDLYCNNTFVHGNDMIPFPCPYSP